MLEPSAPFPRYAQALVFFFFQRVTFCDWTARAVELSAISKPSCKPAWQGLCMEGRSWDPRRQLCPPGIMLLAFATLLSCLLTSGQAKVYSRCELARALQDFGMEGYRGYSMADCENPSPFQAAPGSPQVPPLPPSLPPRSHSGSVPLAVFRASALLWTSNVL